MTTQTYARSRPPSEMSATAKGLLSRYPNLSEYELSILLDIFPRLRILDVGLMTGDDRLASQLKAFHRDHGSKLRSPISSLLGLLAFPAILVLGVLWWYLAPAFEF